MILTINHEHPDFKCPSCNTPLEVERNYKKNIGDYYKSECCPQCFKPLIVTPKLEFSVKAWLK